MKSILIGLGVVVIVVGLGVASCALNIFGAGVNAVSGVVTRTINPDNMIANYEWFKSQYQQINAMDAQIAAVNRSINDFNTSAGPRSNWTFEDKTEANRLSSIRTGLENTQTQMRAEYNARASMANRNIFRTNELPSSL